ncbi:MAG: arylsulfatase [Planctomycetota bacterium]|nr:arylsulfatase [Planctomycetota bacterium]
MLNKLCIALLLLLCTVSHLLAESRPNVVLIMTDDQGIGDFGCTGNPVIQTPHIDAMAKRSLRLNRFYVSPVCAPTRACLMTGRYNYRTRVVDTFNGRAMMDPTEITLAEVLRDHGYRTGIFGKWHLGDCYPMRANDQGFQRSLVHRGGGIGQPSDPLEAAGQYTNPILMDDGEPKRFEGYCTDVYYENALAFMREAAKANEPFFVYLPDNCPHGPFEDAPKDWMKAYEGVDLGNDQFPTSRGEPLRKQANLKKRQQIFSMISNIDENIGQLYSLLDELKIRENTIVIFMTDNGPNGNRYRCSLRGTKTSVYEGGIRTLFLWDWPRLGKRERTSDVVAAHIDVLPTLLEACHIPPPPVELDGRSFYAVCRDSDRQLPNRTLFIQTHRGNQPVAYHHFAAIGQRWKLVNHSGFGKETPDGEPNFELFDLQNDPYEMKDIGPENRGRVREIKAAYDRWFQDVSQTRVNNYDVPRIEIGADDEKVTVLSRQDWRRSPRHETPNESRRQWLLSNPTERKYQVTIHFPRDLKFQTVILHCNGRQFNSSQIPHARGKHRVVFQGIPLPQGNIKLWVSSPQADSDNLAYQVELKAM